MGTRNLVAVQLNGEYKVAQYGQWDGYPSGQGLTALRFLHGMDRESFIQKLEQNRFLSDDDIKACWVEAGADPEAQFVNMEVSEKFQSLYPHLSRDAGANILQLVAESEAGLGLRNSIEFAKDSLFCEWAYVIDFDKGTFEAYKGFNKEGVEEDARFTGSGREEYKAVRLAASWPLSELPDEETFLKTLKEPDEEE